MRKVWVPRLHPALLGQLSLSQPNLREKQGDAHLLENPLAVVAPPRLQPRRAALPTGQQLLLQ